MPPTFGNPLVNDDRLLNTRMTNSLTGAPIGLDLSRMPGQNGGMMGMQGFPGAGSIDYQAMAGQLAQLGSAPVTFPTAGQPRGAPIYYSPSTGEIVVNGYQFNQQNASRALESEQYATQPRRDFTLPDTASDWRQMSPAEYASYLDTIRNPSFGRRMGEAWEQAWRSTGDVALGAALTVNPNWDWAQTARNNIVQEYENNAPFLMQLRNVRTPGDGLTYLSQSLVQGIPWMVETLVSMGVGAMIGGAVSGGVGAPVGAVEAFTAKEGIRRALEMAVRRNLTRGAQAYQSALEATGARTLTREQVIAHAGADAADDVNRFFDFGERAYHLSRGAPAHTGGEPLAGFGALTGSAASNYAMGLGDIRNSIQDAGGDPTSAESVASIWGYALPYALVESMGDLVLTQPLTHLFPGIEAGPSRFGNALRHGALTAGGEGLEEGAQYGITQQAVSSATRQPIDIQPIDLLENVVGGAVAGFGMGGIAGAMERPTRPVTPTPTPSTPPGPAGPGITDQRPSFPMLPAPPGGGAPGTQLSLPYPGTPVGPLHQRMPGGPVVGTPINDDPAYNTPPPPTPDVINMPGPAYNRPIDEAYMAALNGGHVSQEEMNQPVDRASLERLRARLAEAATQNPTDLRYREAIQQVDNMLASDINVTDENSPQFQQQYPELSQYMQTRPQGPVYDQSPMDAARNIRAVQLTPQNQRGPVARAPIRDTGRQLRDTTETTKPVDGAEKLDAKDRATLRPGSREMSKEERQDLESGRSIMYRNKGYKRTEADSLAKADVQAVIDGTRPVESLYKEPTRDGRKAARTARRRTKTDTVAARRAHDALMRKHTQAIEEGKKAAEESQKLAAEAIKQEKPNANEKQGAEAVPPRNASGHREEVRRRDTQREEAPRTRETPREETPREEDKQVDQKRVAKGLAALREIGRRDGKSLLALKQLAANAALHTKRGHKLGKSHNWVRAVSPPLNQEEIGVIVRQLNAELKSEKEKEPKPNSPAENKVAANFHEDVREAWKVSKNYPEEFKAFVLKNEAKMRIWIKSKVADMLPGARTAAERALGGEGTGRTARSPEAIPGRLPRRIIDGTIKAEHVEVYINPTMDDLYRLTKVPLGEYTGEWRYNTVRYILDQKGNAYVTKSMVNDVDVLHDHMAVILRQHDLLPVGYKFEFGASQAGHGDLVETGVLIRRRDGEWEGDTTVDKIVPKTGRTARATNIIVNPKLTREEVEAKVKAIVSKWMVQPEVFVFNNPQHLFDANPDLFALALAENPSTAGRLATNQLRTAEDAKAFIELQEEFKRVLSTSEGYTFNNTIVLFSDRLSEHGKMGNRVAAVLEHEAFGHVGLRLILTKNDYETTMRAVYENLDAAMQNKVTAYADRWNTTIPIATEEVALAEQAEKLATSWWERIADAFQRVLDELFRYLTKNKLGTSSRRNSVQRYVLNRVRNYIRAAKIENDAGTMFGSIARMLNVPEDDSAVVELARESTPRRDTRWDPTGRTALFGKLFKLPEYKQYLKPNPLDNKFLASQKRGLLNAFADIEKDLEKINSGKVYGTELDYGTIESSHDFNYFLTQLSHKIFMATAGLSGYDMHGQYVDHRLGPEELDSKLLNLRDRVDELKIESSEHYGEGTGRFSRTATPEETDALLSGGEQNPGRPYSGTDFAAHMRSTIESVDPLATKLEKIWNMSAGTSLKEALRKVGRNIEPMANMALRSVVVEKTMRIMHNTINVARELMTKRQETRGYATKSARTAAVRSALGDKEPGSTPEQLKAYSRMAIAATNNKMANTPEEVVRNAPRIVVRLPSGLYDLNMDVFNKMLKEGTFSKEDFLNGIQQYTVSGDGEPEPGVLAKLPKTVIDAGYDIYVKETEHLGKSYLEVLQHALVMLNKLGDDTVARLVKENEFKPEDQAFMQEMLQKMYQLYTSIAFHESNAHDDTWRFKQQQKARQVLAELMRVMHEKQKLKDWIDPTRTAENAKVSPRKENAFKWREQTNPHKDVKPFAAQIAWFLQNDPATGRNRLERMSDLGVTDTRQYAMLGAFQGLLNTEVDVAELENDVIQSVMGNYVEFTRRGQWRVAVNVLDEKGEPADISAEFMVKLPVIYPNSLREAIDLQEALQNELGGEHVITNAAGDEIVVKFDVTRERAPGTKTISDAPDIKGFVKVARLVNLKLSATVMKKIADLIEHAAGRKRFGLQRAGTPGMDADIIKNNNELMTRRAWRAAKYSQSYMLDDIFNDKKNIEGDWEHLKQLQDAFDIANRGAPEGQPVPPGFVRNEARVYLAETALLRYANQLRHMTKHSVSRPTVNIRTTKGEQKLPIEAEGRAAHDHAIALRESLKKDELELNLNDLLSKTGPLRMMAVVMQLGSIAAGIMNAFTLITHLPWVLMARHAKTGYGEGFGFSEVIGEIMRAVAQVGKNLNMTDSAIVKRMLDKAEAGDNSTGLTIEELRFIYRETLNGLLQPQQTYSMTGGTESNIRSLFVRNAAQGLLLPFSSIEAMNRRVSALVAYRLAKARYVAAGVSEAELNDPNSDAYKRLLDDVERVVYNSQGDYANINRPKGFRGDLAQYVLTYKMFPLITTVMIQNLPRAQQASVLGVLFLLGGLKGEPFADDFMDIYDTLLQKLGFRHDSVELQLIQSLEEMMPGSSKWVMYGGIDALAFGGTMSSRVSMGDILPLTGIFREEADLGREISNAFGPAYASNVAVLDWAWTLTDWTMQQMGLKTPTTSWQELIRKMPQSQLRAFGEAYLMGSTGQITDPRGRLVSDEVTAYSIMARAIGLYPLEATEANTAVRLDRMHIGYMRAARARFILAYANASMDNDQARMDRIMQDVEAWNTSARETGQDDMLITNFRTAARRAAEAAAQTTIERTSKSAPSYSLVDQMAEILNADTESED